MLSTDTVYTRDYYIDYLYRLLYTVYYFKHLVSLQFIARNIILYNRNSNLSTFRDKRLINM